MALPACLAINPESEAQVYRDCPAVQTSSTTAGVERLDAAATLPPPVMIAAILVDGNRRSSRLLVRPFGRRTDGATGSRIAGQI
jgi:hypothetical protein